MRVELYATTEEPVNTSSQEVGQTMFVADFGTRLRASRKMAGLTMRQLAAKAGCTSSLIGQYETGRLEECRAEMLFKLSDALRVTPRWLATGEGNHVFVGNLSTEEAEIVLVLRALPKATRENLLNLASNLAGEQRPSTAAPYPRKK